MDRAVIVSVNNASPTAALHKRLIVSGWSLPWLLVCMVELTVPFIKDARVVRVLSDYEIIHKSGVNVS